MNNPLNHPQAATWILRLTILLSLSMLIGAAIMQAEAQTLPCDTTLHYDYAFRYDSISAEQVGNRQRIVFWQDGIQMAIKIQEQDLNDKSIFIDSKGQTWYYEPTKAAVPFFEPQKKLF